MPLIQWAVGSGMQRKNGNAGDVLMNVMRVLLQGRAAVGTPGGRAPAAQRAVPPLNLAAPAGRAAAGQAPRRSARAGTAQKQQLGGGPAAAARAGPDVAGADCRECVVRSRGECTRTFELAHRYLRTQCFITPWLHTCSEALKQRSAVKPLQDWKLALILVELTDVSRVLRSGLRVQAVTHFALAGMYAGMALASEAVRLVDLQKVRKKSLQLLSCVVSVTVGAVL